MRVKKEINIQIGEQIKIAREHARITQEQLAERTDVSPQYISDLERGVVGISIATLKRVCTVLCVSSDQILFGQKSGNKHSVFSTAFQSLSPEQARILVEIIEKYVEAINTTYSDICSTKD